MTDHHGEPKFIGQSEMRTESVTIRADPSIPRLDFRCYQQLGMTAHRADKRPDGTFDPSTLRDIPERDGLKAGDEIVFEWPFGGYVTVTVGPDLLFAENGGLYVSLNYDDGFPQDGIPGHWVGGCFGNKKALSRVEFV